MTFDSLREWLRWAFWGFVYLTTLTVAVVVFWRMPFSQELRWCFLAVFVIGIVVDILHKLRPEPPPQPRTHS